MHVYSPHVGNAHQSKVWIPPKFNLVNLLTGIWVAIGAEMTQNSCITKAHPSMGDSLQKLGTLSILIACR